jgi:hypothetical protein
MRATALIAIVIVDAKGKSAQDEPEKLKVGISVELISHL